MRRLFILALLLGASATAGAQIIRPTYRLKEPSVWASLGVGFQSGFSVAPGGSGRWDFGSSTPVVVSLEKALGGAGVSLGVRGSSVITGLRYTGTNGGDIIGSTDADARVSQGFVTLRAASGRGFHSVLELSAGATHFSDFQARPSGAKLQPLAGDTDFTFSFGYGFGFNVTPRFAVDMVQEMGTAVHQKDEFNPSADASVGIRSTRIVARIGF